MRSIYQILLLILSVTGYCSCHQASNQSKKNIKEIDTDTCSSKYDTTIYLQFSKDSSNHDFDQLIKLIEGKGEFSRYHRKRHDIDSVSQSGVYLQKLLCYDLFEKSPIKKYVLQNVYSTWMRLYSIKPLKGTKDYFPAFEITQLNFVNTEEKKRAYQTIREIGWGNPLFKWNDYYIVNSKTRIYILESKAAMFSEIRDRYARIIQKEWAILY
ncbi:MAG: hypothetical protein V4685_18400 [Bacteroidota bacterium]